MVERESPGCTSWVSTISGIGFAPLEWVKWNCFVEKYHLALFMTLAGKIFQETCESRSAALTFFTLDYLGLGERASILDGELRAWRSEGKPVAAEVRAAKPGYFTPRLNQKLWLTRRGSKRI
jgi:hypothetical protein